jgi:hypothetical protein
MDNGRYEKPNIPVEYTGRHYHPNPNSSDFRMVHGPEGQIPRPPRKSSGGWCPLMGAALMSLPFMFIWLVRRVNWNGYRKRDGCCSLTALLGVTSVGVILSFLRQKGARS